MFYDRGCCIDREIQRSTEPARGGEGGSVERGCHIVGTALLIGSVRLIGGFTLIGSALLIGCVL